MPDVHDCYLGRLGLGLLHTLGARYHFRWHGLGEGDLGWLGGMVGWVVGVVTGICWRSVGGVTHVVGGCVGLFVHVRVVVPFL